ncbi:hypothetical protein Trydic_g14553 [Trypoxylus dichotomus]
MIPSCVFQNSLEEIDGMGPSARGFRVIVPVAKPVKDDHSPEGYRPISPLYTISKLCETLLVVRINDHLDDDLFGCRRHPATSNPS